MGLGVVLWLPPWWLWFLLSSVKKADFSKLLLPPVPPHSLPAPSVSAEHNTLVKAKICGMIQRLKNIETFQNK